jgi:SAM-dependent methyltransferase
MPASQKQQTELINYWDNRPCNIRHGTAPIGSLEWSKQVTERKYFVEPHIPGFAQFERWKDEWVLEIGCGIGTDTLQFIKAGAYIFAIDNSVKSIELAIQRCQLEEVDMSLVGWRSWNAEEILPRGGFKLVYSFGVIHHTPHPEKILTLAYDRMADDGELRIMLYAAWSWKHLFTRQQPEAQAGCPFVHWYSVREARKLLEYCGFKIVSIEKTHIFPWRIPDYVQHKYVKAFPWNITPKWLFRWLESKLGHHLLIVGKKA